MGASPTKEIRPGTEAYKVITKTVTTLGNGKTEEAIVAAGCFWGVELAFQRVPGVVKTEVGYIGGSKVNPTYEEVCSGMTGHTEALKINFDTSAVTYGELLSVLWEIVDPIARNRQGNDIGTQYRSGIYYANDNQRQIAFASVAKEQLKYKAVIATEVEKAGPWYPAEPYHQQYLSKGGQCSRKGDTSAIRCYG